MLWEINEVSFHSTRTNGFLMARESDQFCVVGRVIVTAWNLKISRRRLEDYIKTLQVQHDYFSSFNQSLFRFVALLLPLASGFLKLLNHWTNTHNHALITIFTHYFFCSAEEMLKEKDEEDGLSEDDEEQSDEEAHGNDISTSNDETEEEDEEENTFLQRLCNTLVDNIKLLKTRAGRAGLIYNFLRGLSVPCFSGLS